MSAREVAPEVAQEALDSWSTNATHWDEGMGLDGNAYWSELQKPCLARFFANHLKPGCRALDLSTGNGLCARWLAAHGASVLATDGAPGMLEVAKKRTPAGIDVSFRKLDVTDPADFEALLETPDAAESFDIVLMNMAIMDVSTLDPLVNALPKLLKKDGVFAGTLLHPTFFTPRVVRGIQIRDDHEELRREITHSITLTGYLDVKPWRGWADRKQPALQFYFHRPIHELLGTFFSTGLVMDGVEEPAFPAEKRQPHRQESSYNWSVQFPPILAFRMRRGN